MGAIPANLYSQLSKVLFNCGPFDSNDQLRSVFAHPKLEPWRKSVPEASSAQDRVFAVIAFLAEKRRSDTKENALVLLLHVLSDRVDPEDECHQRLVNLAHDLEGALGGSSPVNHVRREANPMGQVMSFVAVDEKLLACARSVGRVSVPRVISGRMERIPTGTGWLVTPDLAFTCWHVVEARNFRDTPISNADLQKQVENSLITFDYTVPSQGIEYGMAALEHYNAALDYAVLRLKDRTDGPLLEQGFLALDADVPLTIQTQLYVIQHPKGQPQQRSSGLYVKPSPHPNRILHSAPTESGTSGAPVLNVTNWRVVALHSGENEAERLREAILVRPILADLVQNQPTLYREIAAAQKRKE